MIRCDFLCFSRESGNMGEGSKVGWRDGAVAGDVLRRWFRGGKGRTPIEGGFDMGH